MTDCETVAPLLTAPLLAGEDAAHLAGCADCRATARALALVRRASGPPERDLWPRLRARLAVAEGRVALRVPTFGWPAAAATVILMLGALVAPEPTRLLGVVLGMV